MSTAIDIIILALLMLAIPGIILVAHGYRRELILKNIERARQQYLIGNCQNAKEAILFCARANPRIQKIQQVRQFYDIVKNEKAGLFGAADAAVNAVKEMPINFFERAWENKTTQTALVIIIIAVLIIRIFTL